MEDRRELHRERGRGRERPSFHDDDDVRLEGR